MLMIFAIAVTPTLGSTVAIPAGIALGYPPVLTTAVAVAGAICKVPLAIWLAGGFRAAARRLPGLDRKLERVERHARVRLPAVRRWGWPALVVCSAIPAPGFGIWTAAMAARLMGFSYGATTAALVLGLMVAGTGVALASLGVVVPILARWLP